MQIRFSNPLHPKFGKTEHIAQAAALALIALGEAEEIRLPKRGAPGWIEARQELSRISSTGPYSGPLGADTVAPFVAGVEWFVRDENGVLFVVRASGSESTRFTEAPAECPENVRKEFVERQSKQNATAIANAEEHARVLNKAR